MRLSGVAAVLTTWVLAIAHADGQSLAPSQAAATVGDEVISTEEVWRRWQLDNPAEFERARRETYEGERRALDAIVGERLLAAEAKTRGLTIDALVAAETDRRVRDVGDDDVSAFLAASPIPPGLSRDVLVPIALTLLRQRARDAAREEFLLSLRRAGDRVRVFLVPPRVTVGRDEHSPVRGRVSAPVEVVVFSDFECPFCRKVTPALRRLVARFPDDVLLIWRHFPLSIHPHAIGAAEAAQCAHDQGRFWEFHDAFFSEASVVESGDFTTVAASLGLDLTAFSRCVRERAHAGRVTGDTEVGRRLGVTGTPTVFVNGVAYVGALEYAAYERAVLEELRGGGSGAATSRKESEQ